MAALLLAGCSPEKDAGDTGTPNEGVKVSVNIGMGGLLSDVSLEPMTRASVEENVIALSSTYSLYIVRKFDGYWVADDVIKQLPYPNVGAYATYLKASQLGYVNIDLILREGDYRLVLLLNSSSGSTNHKLKKGYRFDDGDTPFLITYSRYNGTDPLTEKDPYNLANTYDAATDLYVGVSDEFEVRKSTSLAQSDPSTIVGIDVKRVTGRIRSLMKRESKYRFSFDDLNAENRSFFFLEATGDKKFPLGVDLFGNYYGEVSIVAGYVTHPMGSWVSVPGKGEYCVNREIYTNVSSANFFAPDEGIPCKIGPLRMTAQTGDPSMGWLDEEEFVLYRNKHHSFSFEIASGEPYDIFYQTINGPQQHNEYPIRRVTDESGSPEDSNAYFGPYVEYNEFTSTK